MPALFSLPMYRFNDAAAQALATWLIQQVRTRCADLAQAHTLQWWLQDDGDLLAHWRNPHLWHSQSCGYPYTHALRTHVQLIGSLGYDAEGVTGFHCQSPWLVRADDPRQNITDFAGSRFQANSSDSQSGYHNLVKALLRLGHTPPDFFQSIAWSGGHAASIAALRAGLCDVISVDAVTWAGLQRYQAAACTGLRVLQWSPPYPGLPLISAQATPPAVIHALRQSWQNCFASAETQAWCEALLLTGFYATTPADYAGLMD